MVHCANRMRMRKKRIVIVEDNKFMSRCLGKLLERCLPVKVAGYADDGEAGFTLCMKTCPDLALIDVKMPKMDGLSLVEKLFQKIPQTRFIVISGCVDPCSIWRTTQYGIHGFILKTESINTLLMGVQMVLNNGIFFSPAFEGIKNKLLSDPESFHKILGRREQEVLLHFAGGCDDEQIGMKLGITGGTVGLHRKNMRKKLDLHNDRELMGYAKKCGF